MEAQLNTNTISSIYCTANYLDHEQQISDGEIDYESDITNENNTNENNTNEGNDNNEEVIELFDDNLIPLHADDELFDVIGHVFLSNLGVYGSNNGTEIEAIHKMNWSNSRTRLARLQGFRIFKMAILDDNNDDNNDNPEGVTKYGWYCDSIEGIKRIVNDGFGHLQLGKRHGVCLCHINALAQSVHSCEIDDYGLKHVLLCQLLLEGEKASDDQVISSSEYLVQSTKMNTHILPEYVVTFTTTPCLGGKGGYGWNKHATSPWVPFTTVLPTLSKFLPPHTMNIINENLQAFQEGNISRQELMELFSNYIRNDVLTKIIKLEGVKDFLKIQREIQTEDI